MTIRRPALLIAYGPETRAFVHSGLHQGLVDEGMTPVFFANQPSSEALASMGARPFPEGAELGVLNRLRGFSRRRQGRGAGGLAERVAASLLGGTAGWKRALLDAGVDALICASHNSGRTVPALQTALNMGLPTVVIENSWKDAHGRSYAPARPTAVGFATAAARNAYVEANGRPAQLEVCGSLHLSALARAGFLERSEFCGRLGLDPARPIVCWSTAKAGAVEEEPGWVQWLSRRFEQMEGVRPQLLVRTNPMDRFDAFAAVDACGVALLKPRWEWNSAMDWCCPLEEDALLWASAIRHAAMNVSLASTVTLEFAAYGRPVINPVLGAMAKGLFDSDFYADARRKGWAQPAATLSELEELVLRLVAEPGMTAPSAPRFDATTRALELVTRVGAWGAAPTSAARLSSVRA